jgi:rubredoxin
MPNMRCKICNTPVSEDIKEQVLGTAMYKKLEDKFTKELIGDLIECPSCHEKNSFEP